jgi:hypothetical protein
MTVVLAIAGILGGGAHRSGYAGTLIATDATGQKIVS